MPCCLVVVLMFLGPRFALLFAWLFSHWYDAFSSRMVALLGFIFLPWTSLAWMYTYFHNHGDLSGGYVLLVAFALLLDVGVFGGGGYARRARESS
ncbi:MAG TPA: hypothetical protein VHM19_01120 [Polyangiales bacterium]|jgi:hypothetical protein|nr:hypothetical protein [Polyangiales bacterium]